MRILLIEDETSLVDVLTNLLERENYTVDAAFDGLSGYYQASTSIYDVIILDVMLPKMNGYTVLKNLRNDKINTPVLMLTAKSETDDKVMGLDCGADDYLAKPFDTKELLARIRSVSRRQGEIKKQTLSCGNLELLLNQCEIRNTITCQSVKLGNKEFQLLEYLLTNQNQIITREQIAQKVWGYDNESEYNHVEVYISFTRKKMNFISTTTKIQAIRGIGYTLEAGI